MKKLDEFCIPFSNLKFGSNLFNFEINNSFFEAFDYSIYEGCELILQLDFRKENNLMDLQFHYQGITFTSCDRCLDTVSVDIKSNFKSILKFGHDFEQIINDDVVYLPYESYEYNIAQQFYEHFLLNFPKKVIHDNDLCNSKQIALINKYSNRPENVEFDDRWSKLKDFKTRNKNIKK
tara:strand:+ start:7905 stop:8438 length:534 start_codon:yes stop_codon:yes gene_type:complete